MKNIIFIICLSIVGCNTPVETNPFLIVEDNPKNWSVLVSSVLNKIKGSYLTREYNELSKLHSYSDKGFKADGNLFKNVTEGKNIKIKKLRLRKGSDSSNKTNIFELRDDEDLEYVLYLYSSKKIALVTDTQWIELQKVET